MFLGVVDDDLKDFIHDGPDEEISLGIDVNNYNLHTLSSKNMYLCMFCKLFY